MIERTDSEYRIPVALANAMIIAIFSSLIAIAGYMVVWAINDARWKAHLDLRLTYSEAEIQSLRREIALLSAKIESGQLPIAKQRIDELERRQAQDEAWRREREKIR